jgi:hypothetical protein
LDSYNASSIRAYGTGTYAIHTPFGEILSLYISLYYPLLSLAARYPFNIVCGRSRGPRAYSLPRERFALHLPIDFLPDLIVERTTKVDYVLLMLWIPDHSCRTS